MGKSVERVGGRESRVGGEGGGGEGERMRWKKMWRRRKEAHVDKGGRRSKRRWLRG